MFTQKIKAYQEESIHVIDESISITSYCKLNLSSNNSQLKQIDIRSVEDCENYIESIRKKNEALVAYGGYLEQRNLYSDKSNFINSEENRNIHLGIDFWAKAGTKVVVPLAGVVHSFKNNSTIGDYGPTIVLKHKIEDFVFHTLYGHLSLESIDNLKIGQQFFKGETLGTLGTPEVNVNYAPHLHFQIIIDMEGNSGDYQGVCSKDRLEHYTSNCPDPNILLQLPA